MQINSRLVPIAKKAGAIILALALWQLAAVCLHQSVLLVSPIQVAEHLTQMCIKADFWMTILHSFVRIVLGFFLGAAAGTILAFLSHRFSWVETLLWPYAAAIRSIPVASFIILALVFFSSSRLSVLISLLMVFPVFYSGILQGLKAEDPKLTEMAKLYRLSWLKKFAYLDIPQIKPFLTAACSTALGLCWKSGIAAEVIGIPKGSIGERLYEAKIYLSTPDLFAWTLVILLVSVGFEKLVLFLLRKGYERWERHG